MQRSISMAALELATTRHYGTTYIYTYIYISMIGVARRCVRCRLFSLYAERDVGSRAIWYPGQGLKNCHKLNSIRVAFFRAQLLVLFAVVVTMDLHIEWAMELLLLIRRDGAWGNRAAGAANGLNICNTCKKNEGKQLI